MLTSSRDRILETVQIPMLIHSWYVTGIECGKLSCPDCLYSSYWALVTHYFDPLALTQGVWYVFFSSYVSLHFLIILQVRSGTLLLTLPQRARKLKTRRPDCAYGLGAPLRLSCQSTTRTHQFLGGDYTHSSDVRAFTPTSIASRPGPDELCITAGSSPGELLFVRIISDSVETRIADVSS